MALCDTVKLPASRLCSYITLGALLFCCCTFFEGFNVSPTSGGGCYCCIGAVHFLNLVHLRRRGAQTPAQVVLQWDLGERGRLLHPGDRCCLVRVACIPLSLHIEVASVISEAVPSELQISRMDAACHTCKGISRPSQSFRAVSLVCP